MPVRVCHQTAAFHQAKHPYNEDGLGGYRNWVGGIAWFGQEGVLKSLWCNLAPVWCGLFIVAKS